MRTKLGYSKTRSKGTKRRYRKTRSKGKLTYKWRRTRGAVSRKKLRMGTPKQAAHKKKSCRGVRCHPKTAIRLALNRGRGDNTNRKRPGRQSKSRLNNHRHGRGQQGGGFGEYLWADTGDKYKGQWSKRS